MKFGDLFNDRKQDFLIDQTLAKIKDLLTKCPIFKISFIYNKIMQQFNSDVDLYDFNVTIIAS